MSFRFLERLALASARRYRVVFVVILLLTAVAGLLATRLHFDTDVLNLLPKHDPKIEHFLEAMERFGGVDYLLVGIRIPEDHVPEPYELLADRLGERLGKLDDIKKIDYRIGAPEELIQQVYPRSMLFLDEHGREVLDRRLQTAGIRERVREIRRLLTTPQSLALKNLVKLDPFGLAQIFLDRLETNRGQLAVDWTSGYYLSKDHRMLLLLARPTLPPQDTEFDVRLVDAVQREVDTTLAEWQEIVSPDAGASAPPPPEVVLGGSYLTALDDYKLIRGDMIRNMVTSTVLVLALFLLAFHRLGPLIYATLPLACGLIWTFGFSAVTVGSLSSATSGTAALLIGLGIDFVIVSYGRYVEERRKGLEMEPALAVMARSSGRAVVVGAVTTAATFFAFLVTDFTGLRQMGFLTGTGILFCMLAVLVLLPALISWGEHRHRRRDTQPNLYLHSFGTGPLMRGANRYPKTALAIGLVVTAAALWAAFGLEFEEGMKSMRPEKGNRGIDVGKEVAAHFDSGFDAMMLMIKGDTLDEIFDRSGRAAEGAQKLADDGVILGYSSLTSIIPPPSRQRADLQWLAHGRESGLLDPDRIEADFHAALAEEGLRSAPFEHGLALFRQALEVDRPMSLDDVSKSAEAGRLLDRYLQRVTPPAGTAGEQAEAGDGAGSWVSVVYLYPPHNRWRRRPPPQAVALADQLGPHVVLTGPNVVNQRMRERVRVDAVVAAVLGFLLVAILLWIDFGRLRDAGLALTPLLVGIIWMLGGMDALGIKMNFMNVFVTTMIIGIGVDYGIHAVHRYRENAGSGNGHLSRGLIETGKAIVVASLSTVVGFGSLATSRYPGLRSTGYVAILGALATALVAITLLPAFLALLEARRSRARSEAGER